MCYPIPVDEAICRRVCRLCHRPLVMAGIAAMTDYDEDTPDSVQGVSVEAGRECAHTGCLRQDRLLRGLPHA